MLGIVGSFAGLTCDAGSQREKESERARPKKQLVVCICEVCVCVHTYVCVSGCVCVCVCVCVCSVLAGLCTTHPPGEQQSRSEALPGLAPLPRIGRPVGRFALSTTRTSKKALADTPAESSASAAPETRNLCVIVCFK